MGIWSFMIVNDFWESLALAKWLDLAMGTPMKDTVRNILKNVVDPCCCCFRKCFKHFDISDALCPIRHPHKQLVLLKDCGNIDEKWRKLKNK